MAAPSGGRDRTAILAAMLTVVLLGGVAALVGLVHSRPAALAEPPRWVAAGQSTSSARAQAAPLPSDSPSPSPSPSPSHSVRPSTVRKVKVKPVPSHAPVPLPPPAAPPPAPSCKKSYSGTAASLATVQSALNTASARKYQPTILDVPPRDITVSATLLKAVGWQESGWQSNVVSCDNAYGVMQLLDGTADWMNDNYGSGYDLHTAAGNVSLGAEYLAWLIYYFGHFCFADHYDTAVLDANAPDLRDAVLAAYYSGVGAVDTDAGLVIPNRGYTNAVEGLMVSQPWNKAPTPTGTATN
jgi:soluble lytic murein transglycosylase-like protein